jgi:CubicO group peptidase (beta-lactamase class C family)
MNRLDYISSLFSGASQRENFKAVGSAFPVATMTASADPQPFAEGEAMRLPATYSHKGEARDTEQFLADTDTMALLVIKDGKLKFERYAEWGGRDVHWVSMSVAKSFVSAAIGIAIGEGLIGSVDEKITDYLPQIKGSAYDDVPIKDILQMS